MASQAMTIAAPAPLAPGYAETASSAIAAAAAATVQARYVMALQRQRNVDQVRAKLLEACRRPGFAEVAIYERPVGRKKNADGEWEEAYIRGPSIRFAEECARQYGNILVQSPVLFEDADKRIIRVVATDLETNFCWEKDITIGKTVERRQLKKNQQAKGTRVNSYGDTVYIVEATDEELETKAAAHVSKAARTCIMRLIPGDIVEEGMSQCEATMRDKDAKDPQAAKKAIVDSFAKLNIMPVALIEYLGHTLDTVTPAELAKLRGLFTALRDGATTWSDVMADVAESRGGAANDGKTQAQKTAEIIEQKRSAQAAQAKPVEDPEPAQTQDARTEEERNADAELAEEIRKNDEAKKVEARTAPAVTSGGRGPAANSRRGTAPIGGAPKVTHGTIPTDEERAAEAKAQPKAIDDMPDWDRGSGDGQ
jgi:hypothetical protein